MMEYKQVDINAGFPLVGRDWGDPLPLPGKLASPPMSPALFYLQNIDFIIFMQFLVILLKMSLVGALVEPKWKILQC